VARGSSVGAIIVVIWLFIGVIATTQRGYFKSTDASCATTSTILVTIVAGPLNYMGVNPKVDCTLPQPSK
jgi:hypothetical protein